MINEFIEVKGLRYMYNERIIIIVNICNPASFTHVFLDNIYPLDQFYLWATFFQAQRYLCSIPIPFATWEALCNNSVSSLMFSTANGDHTILK